MRKMLEGEMPERERPEARGGGEMVHEGHESGGAEAEFGQDLRTNRTGGKASDENEYE
jgi:hypothetical protein